jgi:hypothetical protein
LRGASTCDGFLNFELRGAVQFTQDFTGGRVN